MINWLFNGAIKFTKILRNGHINTFNWLEYTCWLRLHHTWIILHLVMWCIEMLEWIGIHCDGTVFLVGVFSGCHSKGTICTHCYIKLRLSVSVCLYVCVFLCTSMCMSVCLSVHLCSIQGSVKVHEPLCLAPNTTHNFCIFSVVFSQDNNELLGGYDSLHSLNISLSDTAEHAGTSLTCWCLFLFYFILFLFFIVLLSLLFYFRFWA